MDEGTSGGGLGESSSSAARVMPSYRQLGDRQIFTVELRPGETTFVSWKKLMKDANKVNSDSVTAEAEPPPVNAHPNLESRLAAGQPGGATDMEEKEPTAPNRYSAVIEKIERLYMGKDSSDDEDLKDVPDDDQYDTEDSFIDDADLDEYFEVDNSAIKHSGFFVNRGKLERISEPPVIPDQQVKKRRRKDFNKASGESDDGRKLNKHAKVGKLAAGKTAPPPNKNSLIPLQVLAETSEQFNEHFKDLKTQTQSDTSGISFKKKSAETKMNVDASSYIKVSNGDVFISLAEANETEKLKTGGLQAKNLSGKSKDASGLLDASNQKHHDKSAYPQSKVQSSKSASIIDNLELPVRSKERNGVRELPDLNMPDGKMITQVNKPSLIHKRDSSGIKSKGSVLENAIRELERMVAESRPPALDNQDADATAQAIKRRLPREIKLKLAKVGRIASREGKLTKEFFNRLMSILGHLIQLRTLKRNLKVMINMSSSVKKEKDDRFQQIKKEVAEIIKTHVPSESKDMEQAGPSDDFQEIDSQEKASLKRKFSMDNVLEDKICDLYDLFVDGLDEDAGPQVRKLYVELAKMWPNGVMDNHEIKRAICRSKERKRALLLNRQKEQDKIKKKKTLTPTMDNNVGAEAGFVATQQSVRDKVPIDVGGPVLALASKSITNSASAAVREPSPSRHAPNVDRQKHDKPKGSMDEAAKIGVDAAVVKKKAKRKPESELDEAHMREKIHAQSSEERHKSSIKQAPVLSQKLNFQLTTPSFEQSS